MSYFIQGQSHPVPSRDELVEQLPAMAGRFETYAAYAEATTEALFTLEERDRALVLEAHTFETTVFENRGGGQFQPRALPVQAQFAPVRAVLTGDVDGDGLPELHR